MGEKNDDVIEDRGTKDDSKPPVVLDPPKSEWVTVYLHHMGEKPTVTGVTSEGGSPTTDKTPETSPKGPTKAEALLKEVNAPRPLDLSVPPGANEQETNAIDKAHAKLVELLKSQGDSEDVSEAEGLILSIRSMVTEVPLRIQRDLEERRKTLRSALSQLKVPDGLPDTERLPLEERGGTLDKALGEAATIEALEKLTSAVTDHGDKLRETAEAVTRRTKAAEVLSGRIGNARPSDDALDTESGPLREAGDKLLQRLAPPLTDSVLQEVDTATGELEDKVRKLNETVVQRGETAGNLRDRLAKIKPAAGLPEDEAKNFGTKVAEAVKALAKPYSHEMLVNAGKQADDLEEEVKRQALAVIERGQRAETLRLRLQGIKTPPRVTQDEDDLLKKAVLEATALLKAPHAVLTLDGVEKTALDLEGQVVTLGQTVAKRDGRADKVRERMTNLGDPPGLNDTEKEDLKKAREAARNLLADPPNDKALGDAETKADEAELLGKTIATAISNRELKRKSLVGELDVLDLPGNAAPGDFRARSKAQGALRKQIADANTDDTLQKADEAVKAEAKIVTGMIDLLAERALAAQDIQAARGVLASEASTADQGFLARLRTTVVNADRVLPGLSDKPAVAKLRKDIADVLGRLNESKVYAAELRTFLVNSQLLLSAPGLANKATVETARETVRLAAQAEATALEYGKARTELANFAALSGVAKGDLTRGADWQDALKDFATKYQAKLDLIAKSKIVDTTNKLLEKVSAARAVPAATTDMKVAIKALTDLGPQVDALSAVAELWQRFMPLKSVPASGIPAALAAAEVNLLKPDYPAALADLQTTTVTNCGDRADAMARYSRLNAKVGNMHAAAGTTKTYVKNSLITPANSDIGTANYTDAKAKLDEAERIIDEVALWAPAFVEVTGLGTAHDSTNAYGLANAALTLPTSPGYDFSAKMTPLADAATKLRKLAEVNAAKLQAVKLRDGLTATTPPHALCLKALTDAEDALTKDKDPAKALGVLEGLFANSLVKAMAAEIALWQARHPKVKAATDRIAKLITDPAPKAALEKSLTAAEDEVKAHKYAAALDLLDAHEPLLKQARSYVSARERALGVHKALLRAETELSGSIPNVFGTVGKPALQKAINDCALLAAKTDFEASAKEYAKFLKTCEPLLKAVAEGFEAKDALGSNAGHSLDRHGPGVTDDKLLRRLQTGLAPESTPTNVKMSATNASSKFESMEAWLAGRERALEDIKNQGFDMTETSYAVPPLGTPKPTPPVPATKMANGDPKLEATSVVDHEGPIDKAVSGIKPNTELGRDGTFEDADTYESYEELSGITKSTTKAVFVIDPPPDGDTKRPANLNAYKERYKAMIEKQNTEAKDLWNKGPKTTPAPADKPTHPATVPGHWVVMQHFPLVKGWDQEKGDYIA